MKSALNNLTWLLIVLPLAGCILAKPVQAQSIVPAPDGTGTLVTPNGNRIDIGGGQLSGDQANLFHSFTQFGVSQDQIANFLSTPDIQNILGRVVGGDASVINGLIQVSGSNANLYLLNPAGIIFGTNAAINVPGSFTATTANGIGIGGGWFNATGTNNYAALVGTPDQFTFATSQPGAIVNAGNLSVATGEKLTLLGGTVINTGTLTAPGGEITIAAVPGGSLVRLSQPGSLLSIEIEPLATAGSSAPSLPQLLTGGTASSATGLTVNPSGQVVLTTGTAVPATPGVAIVSGTVNASNPVSGQTGGTVQVIGQKVGLVDSSLINVSGDAGGGAALIGGDYKGQGTIPNAKLTTIGLNVAIRANALTSGDGGKIIAWSDDTTQVYGTLSARGGATSGNGGFIETSGKVALTTTGATVDASAPNGQAGTWLLDPSDITIDDAGAANGTFVPPALFDPPASTNVRATQIEAALDAGTNVSISTASGAGGTGTITVNSTIDKTAGGNANLTLTGTTITFNAGIVSTSNVLNVALNAPTVNLNAQITAVPASGVVLTGTATTANVNTGGLIQNGINVIGPAGGTVNIAGGHTNQSTIGIPRSNLVINGVAGNIVTGNTSFDFTNSTNVTLRNVNFDGIIGAGFTPVKVTGPSTNLRIESNRFNNIVNETAIFIANGPNVGTVITNNTFTNIGTPPGGTFLYSGIRVNNTASNLTITNNTLTGVDNSGIAIDGPNGVTISGNTITNTGGTGIQVADAFAPGSTGNVTIANNTITNANIANATDSGGIRLRETASFVGTGVTISNNIITSSRTGIAIRNAQAPNLNNVRINLNDLSGNATAGIYTGDTAGTGILDATGNFWGAGGPTDARNPGGAGSAIIGVNRTLTAFSPWITSGADDNAALAGLQITGARTFIVAPNAGQNICLAPTNCIQRAVTLAALIPASDSITVRPGTYPENVLVNTPITNLTGQAGAIISPAGGTALTFNSPGSTTTLSGFTLQNFANFGILLQSGSLTVQDGTTINSNAGATGIGLQGPGSSFAFAGAGTPAFFTGAGNYFNVQNTYDGPSVDARTVQFQGKTSLNFTAAELADTDARIFDQRDNAALRLVILDRPAVTPPVTPPGTTVLNDKFVLFPSQDDLDPSRTEIRREDTLETSPIICVTGDEDDETRRSLEQRAIPLCINTPEGVRVPKSSQGSAEPKSLSQE